jgi:hypothetical protein
MYRQMLRKFLTGLATAVMTAGLLSFAAVGSVAGTDGGTFQWGGNGFPNNTCDGTLGDTMLWIFNPHSDAVPTKLTINGEDFTGWSNSGGGQNWHLTVTIDGTDWPPTTVSVDYTGTVGDNAVLTLSGCNEGNSRGKTASIVTTVHAGDTDADPSNPVTVDDANAAADGDTVHDSAVLSWSGGGFLPVDSYVVFYFYDSHDCSTDPIDDSGHIDVSGATSPDALDPYLPETVTAGEYSYKAVFTSGDASVISDATADCEPFTVSPGQAQGDALSITKSASGSYDNTYAWTIDKSVDKTRVEQIGGTATFHYTVEVSHDGGTIGNVKVTGSIAVFNTNIDDQQAVVPVAIDSVTDSLSDGTTCTVTGGGAQSLTKLETDFDYSCDLSALPSGQLDNTATVTWSAQDLSNGSHLIAGAPTFTFEDVQFTGNDVDECIDVTDTYAGDLGNVCVGDTNPKDLTYSRTVNVPAHGCVDYDNTATFTANDTGATDDDSQTVTVCGPAATGALTMGFWQNKNGQGIISGQAKTGTCGSATYLRTFAPFQDLSSTATCAQTATYVYNVIKAATCTSSTKTCNSMLKAQMLATALDVYFSDPALGGNKIKAPAPIGGISIDLTKICSMIDGSGGSGSCSGSFSNVSAQFGGATCLTVSGMLTYAASQSNIGGTTWYGQVKASQVNTKNAFDAVNNQVAFSC